MSHKSKLEDIVLLSVLAVGIIVLTGCQQTTVDASRGPLGVENSTATTVTHEDQARDSAEIGSHQSVVMLAAQPAIQTNAPRPQASSTALVPQVPPTSAPRPQPVSPITVPARTILVVELDKTLSSHASQVGENFRSILVQDVAADGRIALPRDAVVLGRVTEAKPAKKVGGRARLSLEFYSVRLPDGQELPLEVVFAQVGKSQTTKDAAIIGGSTLGGAVIGHAVNKGEGTAIGAIVGGLAGAAVANETRAKPVAVNAGTVLTLEMVQPLTVQPHS